MTPSSQEMTRFTLRLRSDLAERLGEQPEVVEDDRSLNWQINQAVETYLEQRDAQVISVRLPLDLIDWLTEQAESVERSTNWWIRNLIQVYRDGALTNQRDSMPPWPEDTYGGLARFEATMTWLMPNFASAGDSEHGMTEPGTDARIEQALTECLHVLRRYGAKEKISVHSIHHLGGTQLPHSMINHPDNTMEIDNPATGTGRGTQVGPNDQPPAEYLQLVLAERLAQEDVWFIARIDGEDWLMEPKGTIGQRKGAPIYEFEGRLRSEILATRSFFRSGDEIMCLPDNQDITFYPLTDVERNAISVAAQNADTISWDAPTDPGYHEKVSNLRLVQPGYCTKDHDHTDDSNCCEFDHPHDSHPCGARLVKSYDEESSLDTSTKESLAFEAQQAMLRSGHLPSRPTTYQEKRVRDALQDDSIVAVRMLEDEDPALQTTDKKTLDYVAEGMPGYGKQNPQWGIAVGDQAPD